VEEAAELLRLLSGRVPSRDELESVRLRRVRSLVRHAFENVPYYRRLFQTVGLHPEDVRSAGDLRLIPTSTREELRGAGADLFARGFDPGTAIMARTSGSTGRPWSIYRSVGENRLRRALDFRSMRCAGIQARDLVVTLGPVKPVNRPLAKLGLYRTVHISPLLEIDEQIERLRRLQPSVLWIYPSSLRAVLRRAGSLSAVVTPRLLITGAEPFDDLLRRRVLAERPVETRNFYGAVESGRIAFECAAREGLHVNSDWVDLDLLPEDGVAGGRPVVITNLFARSMSILRYRLGDRCEWIEKPCSCGSSLPLIRPPVGRDWERIELPSGKLLSPFGISASVVWLPELLQYRVIQRRIDWLVVQLLCESPPSADALAAVRARLESYIGEPMRVDLELVDRIEKIAGKARVYVSEIPSRELASAPEH
jgi:phenylacetate-CoA ligase